MPKRGAGRQQQPQRANHQQRQPPAPTAPYNWVPLPDKVLAWEGPPPRNEFAEDRFYGRIHIKVTTKTPVFIPAAPEAGQPTPDETRDDDTGNRSAWQDWEASPRSTAEFFHHGNRDRPVLAGSELRGVIRNIAAIVSDSRLDTWLDTSFTYRALMDIAAGGPNGHVQRYRQHFDSRNGQYGDKVHGGFLFKIEENGQYKWIVIPGSQLNDWGYARIAHRHLPRGENNEPTGVLITNEDPHLYSAKRGPITLAFTRLQQTQVVDFYQQPQGFQGEHVGVVARARGRHYVGVVFVPDGWNLDGALDATRVVYILEKDAAFEKTSDLVSQRLRDAPVWPTNAEIDYRTLLPVFYLPDGNGGIKGLGMTPYFRIPAGHTPRQLADKKMKSVGSGEGSGAGDEPCMDFVTSVFGSLSVRSRVSFLDLELEAEPPTGVFLHQNDEYRNLVDENGFCTTKTALLAPKWTAPQMYLDQSHTNGDRKKLKNYDDDDAVIRGFKLYWHRDAWMNELCPPGTLSNDPSRELHPVMRPVAPGVVFRGWVEFDGLTGVELGGLLLALDPGGQRCHKIGRAKTLGLGSIKVEVERVELLDPDAAVLDEQGNLVPGSRAATNDELVGWRSGFQFALNRHRRNELGKDFWGQARMVELDALLDWDRKPCAADTEVMPKGDKGWQARYPLPTASEVAKARTA